MRTLILIALLLPLSAAAQNAYDRHRSLRPEEVDPYEQYIFQHAIANGWLPDGHRACVGLFIIQSSGEWVKIATSMELCQGAFPKGTYMNFKPKVICNDSIQ